MRSNRKGICQYNTTDIIILNILNQTNEIEIGNTEGIGALTSH